MVSVHHRRVEELKHLEQRIFRELADAPHLLNARQTELLRYAFGFARLSVVSTDHGDIDLFDYVAPFRHWFNDQLNYLTHARRRVSILRPTPEEEVDWKGVAQLADTLFERLDSTRTHLLQALSHAISDDRLEEEICQKRLVLVLGGGGGAGYPHLGVFSVVAELGLTPSLIVGSSMGALLGLFRSISLEYDPGAIALGLPRPSEFRRVFSPYRGFSRFGFPGAMELRIRPVAKEIFSTILGQSVPPINETPIPLRPVVTGLRTGMGFALTEVEREISRSERVASPLRVPRRLGLFFRTMQTLLQNPRFLDEVVFGSDEGLQDVDIVDAVGFSCAVPGIIHYDIFRKDAEIASRLRTIFQDRGFFRITDGGVVANVPSRIAWDCVQRGEIKHRNAFIMSFDAMAPLLNTNAPFYPIERLIAATTVQHIPYSDLHMAYRSPPSPMKLLQSYDSLQTVMARTREELAPARNYIQLMMRPIPRWSQLIP